MPALTRRARLVIRSLFSTVGAGSSGPRPGKEVVAL